MADTPLDPKAREALNAYAARTSPPDAARLDAIWHSVDAPRRSWRWVWLPVVAAAAAAVVVFARPSPVPPAPVVETVRLDRGRVEVRPRAGATRTVVTPQATFVVQQAAAWLEVTPLPLAAVAEALGYADAPAFVRAFRRWAGCTPGQWRAAAVKPPAAP